MLDGGRKRHTKWDEKERKEMRRTVTDKNGGGRRNIL